MSAASNTAAARFSRPENSARAHAAGLPPVAHSKSLSTATLTTLSPNVYGLSPSSVIDASASQPTIYHQRAAKSCDFDAMGAGGADVMMRADGIASDAAATTMTMGSSSMHPSDARASRRDCDAW